MTNLFISFRDTSSMHPISYPPRITFHAASLDRTYSCDVNWMRIFSDLRPPQIPRGHRHTELELLPGHLREEACSPLGRTIFQRGRIAGRDPVGGLAKDFTPRTCPLSCMPVSAARLGLTIGYACSCANGPAWPCSNIRRHRY
jgi:hypothetical protein